LIGEAARHIPDDVKSAHPEIPWRMMIATRNQLIHGYLGIDSDIIWSIIHADLPALLSMLETMNCLYQQQKSLLVLCYVSCPAPVLIVALKFTALNTLI
jgi:uncharacterized protein with HEPN domain